MNEAMRITIEIPPPLAEVLRTLVFMSGTPAEGIAVQSLGFMLGRDMSSTEDLSELIGDAVCYAEDHAGLKERCLAAMRERGKAGAWFDRARVDVIVDEELGLIDGSTREARLRAIQLAAN